jgi:hypothetical protein
VRPTPTPTSVVVGGRKVPISRPRARTVDGLEVQLESYATVASDDVLNQVVLERMLAGVATRRHQAAGEPVGDAVEAVASSTSKSAISRRFVQATAAQVTQLMGRNLATLDVAVLMIDGIIFAEHCCVVAMAITVDGTKVPVGLWLGDTENTTVVSALLADPVGRGLDHTGGLLVVIDGAKALRAAVRKVFGELALVQRCTLHKRRIDRPSGRGACAVRSQPVVSRRRRWTSRVVMTRSWRAVSSVQPRRSASSRRVWMSASWARMTGANSGAGAKLSHCSQMLA